MSVYKTISSSISRRSKLVILLFLSAILTGKSHAGFINVEASATVDTYADSHSYIPLGERIYSSLSFEVSAGAYNSASVSNASGSFSWYDSSNILRSFSVNGVSDAGAHSNGEIRFFFDGSGPELNGLTPYRFYLAINVGENPFGSTSDLEELLIGGSIASLGYGARYPGGGTRYAYARTDARGTVSAATEVSEPSTFALLLLGFAGLLASRRDARS